MTRARRLTRWVAAGLASAVALFVMARASALPLPYHSAATAHLRLSWNARPERIEVCRERSEEELARLEEHMRQRVECEGRFATYALRVAVDDRVLDETVVRGSGLRNDRPIYLLRDFDVAAGDHRVRISFNRRERTEGAGDEGERRSTSDEAERRSRRDADTGIFQGRAERERLERMRRTGAAIPARLVLDTSLTFAPGRVLIVTFAADRRAFTVLERARESR